MSIRISAAILFMGLLGCSGSRPESASLGKAINDAAKENERLMGEIEQLKNQIAELKRAHLEVARTIESDRSISASARRNQDAYDRALAMRDLPFITSQIADGASVLAAIWLFEWRQAGRPQVCDSRF